MGLCENGPDRISRGEMHHRIPFMDYCIPQDNIPLVRKALPGVLYMVMLADPDAIF